MPVKGCASLVVHDFFRRAILLLFFRDRLVAEKQGKKDFTFLFRAEKRFCWLQGKKSSVVWCLFLLSVKEVGEKIAAGD